MFYNNLPKRTNHLKNLYKSEEEIGAESLQKAEEADMIQKGRKAEPIGTRKKWGKDEYIKTAQGWKMDKGHKSTHQSDTFEHNGYTVQRHHQSVTQGTYTVHKDGKQIGGGHYDQSMHDSKNDGRGNMHKKTDHEIKQEVDKIVENHGKKEEIKDLLQHTSLSEGLKKDLADYFISPSFPELKSIKDFKGKTVEDTKNNFLGLKAFQGGRFVNAHAGILARALHGTPSAEDSKKVQSDGNGYIKIEPSTEKQEFSAETHKERAAHHFDEASKHYFAGNHEKSNEHHEKAHEHLVHALGKDKEKFNSVFNNPDVKVLTIGSGGEHKPLSSQLSALTGDSYNVHDFEGNASTGSILTHKKTGQKFTAVNHKHSDLVKHYQEKNKETVKENLNLPYSEANQLPKGGAAAMSKNHLQAQAANAIASKHGIRGEALYNWANTHGIDLVGNGKVGAALSNPRNRMDLLQDVLSGEHNATKHLTGK